MSGVEKQEVIRVPAGKVFTYVSDLTRHAEWAAHELQIEQTSEGSVGKGSTFRSVGHQLGRDNEDKITVTEFSPDETFAFESEGNAGRIRHWFRIESEEDGVRLAKGTEAVETKFPFSLLFPVISAFTLPGAMQGDLDRIKAKLEEGAD